MKRDASVDVIQVLFALAIFTVGIMLISPYVEPARLDTPAHDRCGWNLRWIGQGLLMYQSLYGDRYPLISDAENMDYRAEMVPGGSDDVFGLDEGEPGAEDTGEQTALNINENLNLLVARDAVGSWGSFRCPGVSTQTMDRGLDENHRYGFRDADGQYFYDYAYHVGYTSPVGVSENAAPFRWDMGEKFPLMTDRPGTSLTEFRADTGFAHADGGLTVLYADGHIEHVKSVEAGWSGNNVYMRDISPGGVIIPNPVTRLPAVHEHDSVCIEADPR